MNVELAPFDLGMLVGLFEGEGFFCSVRPRPGKAVAGVEMTDEDVILRFAKLIGCGHVNKRLTVHEGHKQSWEWRTSARDTVIAVGKLLRPRLGVRRQGQIDAVMAMYAKHPPCRRPPTILSEDGRWRFIEKEVYFRRRADDGQWAQPPP